MNLNKLNKTYNKSVWLLLTCFIVVNNVIAQDFKLPDEISKFVVIPLIYENGLSFSEKLAPVMQDGKWGMIDTSNSFIVKPDYKSLGMFYNGLAIAENETGKLYINKKNENTIKLSFAKCKQFSENLAPVLIKGKAKFCFINLDGKIQLPEFYENAFSFSEGLAAVKLDGKYGFIDKKGVLIIKNTFEYSDIFSENIATVYVNNKYGFINKKGEIIIKPQFDEVKTFSGKVCAVKVNNKWGFIDSTGNYIIKSKYDEAGNFKEGLAPVLSNGKWGFINKTDEFIIKPFFDFAYSFNEGFAGVMIRNNEKTFYGFIKNPFSILKSKEKVKPDSSKSKVIEEPDTKSFISCGQSLHGWEGNISNIHKIDTPTDKIKIKWEFINKEFGIIVYEGIGLKGKVLFKEKQIKYTGEKSIKIKSTIKNVTIQILAKKEKTEWKYIMECD